MKKNLTRGFTLIEMLIVVTIIGIIVGIGVPALRDAKQKAAQAKQDSVIATIATAKTRYTLDSTDPQITAFNGMADTSSTTGPRFNALQNYILVKGVPVADIPTLLAGTGMGNLTIGNLNVGTAAGGPPTLAP
jgi:prepilin-type N-terminal cleavage/methylation domain-containing protein